MKRFYVAEIAVGVLAIIVSIVGSTVCALPRDLAPYLAFQSLGMAGGWLVGRYIGRRKPLPYLKHGYDSTLYDTKQDLDRLFYQSSVPPSMVGLDGIAPVGEPPTHIVIEETGEIIELGKGKPRTNPLLPRKEP